MNQLRKIFKKDRNIIIGAIHFPPLAGYPEFPGMEVALKNALLDLKALEAGGADAIIIENNYDIPHYANVSEEVAACLSFLGEQIKKETSLPIGISVLWNDYKTALTLSRKLELTFIRVPVFVDTVKTGYGVMKPAADEAVAFRQSIGAENVCIFADIHVKHSEIISTMTIEESAKLAIEKGADALIVTGKWTGDAPDVRELSVIRTTVGDFPLFCGSGVDKKNAKALFRHANGAIVSTSLKEDSAAIHEVNIRPYESRISEQKTRELVDSVRGE